MARRRFVLHVSLILALVMAAAVATATLGMAASSGSLGKLSPTLSTSDRLDDRRFVAAGDRAYEVGTEAGRYPAMGFHTRGEMGGVWTAPLKLLDGLWFGVDGSWVGPATTFTSGYGYAQFQLPGPAGVGITRTDFAPDGRRALEVGLTFDNSGGAKHLSLALDAHSELMSAYPWGATTPDQTAFNLPDQAAVAGGRLVFREQGTPPVANASAHDWAALVGSSLTPTASSTGSDFRGPQDPPVICPVSSEPDKSRCDDTAYGKGAGGQLDYALDLAPHASETVWFTVAGSDHGLADATAQFTAASADPAGELAAKAASRLALAKQTQLTLPGDPQLAQGVEWGKQNLADLTQEAQDLSIRPTEAGTVYPAPVGHVAKIRFEGAGFPDYPWLFATDGEYTAFALAAAGQFDLIKDHLRALRDVSLIANHGSGKVVHEVVTDGSVYFGLNDEPGDTDETAKFPGVVALVWRWTGDNAFRDEMYAFAKSNLEYLLTRVDVDHDLWPEGSGNVEAPGLGQEKLDVTVYTIRGLFDLADMAASKHDSATQAWALSRANSMVKRFESTWYMPNIPGYADSLVDPGNVKTQQRWWIGVTPMEVELFQGTTPVPGLAATASGNASLTLHESSCYTGTFGLFVQGAAGCDPAPPPASPNRITFSLNTAIQSVGEGNYGRMGADQQQRYTTDNRELMLPNPDEQPGDLPEIAPSPDFTRNIDRPFNERSMVEQAWGQYGLLWPAVHQQLGVSPDLGMGLLEVVPQVPSGQATVSGSNILVGKGAVSVTATHSGTTWTTDVTASAAISAKLTIGHTLPTGTKIASVTLNGSPVPFTTRTTNRGEEALVPATTGTLQHLVITTA
ncbi:MAG TPA: glycogen debranching protein [Actinomycetota bacterium]